MSNISPEKFKKDNRTAQQVASDILNKMLIEDESSRGEEFNMRFWNFLTTLDAKSYDVFNDPDFAKNTKREYGDENLPAKAAVLFASLEQVKSGAFQQHSSVKEVLSHSLKVLDIFINSLDKSSRTPLEQSDGIKEAFKIIAESRKKPGEDAEKLSENYMESDRVAQFSTNSSDKKILNGLEELKSEFRILASKLNIKLVEPEGPAHGGPAL